METEKQRQLELMRRTVPIVGGLAILLVGNWILFRDGVDVKVVRSVLASMAIIGGVFLCGLGVASMKYRRWMFSIEDRLKKFEDSSAHKSTES